MKNIAALLILFPLIASCQNNTKKEVKETAVSGQMASNQNDMQILKKQLKEGYEQIYSDVGVEIPKEKFSPDELDAATQSVKDILRANGYKAPAKDVFAAKVKAIFGRVIDFSSDKKYLYVNNFDNCDKEMVYLPNDGTDVNGAYIVKDGGFITDFYYLPEIIDYQKKYPEAFTEEGTLPVTSKNERNETVKVALWKDKPGLMESRKKNVQLLVARNSYLFNDSKAHYKWLTLHDSFFMESLVTTFGYTDDVELLKWVIEKNFPATYNALPDNAVYTKIAPLLYTKKCDGGIDVHQNTLKVFKELSTPKNNKYIMYVAEYLQHGLCLGCDKDAVKHDLTFAQEAKVGAYLLEFGEQFKYDKAYSYKQMFLGNFYYYTDYDKKYINEFKKNNFYGLPKLKEWYDAAAKEPDMFKNNDFDDNPQPQNYLDRVR